MFYQRNARGTFVLRRHPGPLGERQSVRFPSNLKSLGDFLAGYVSSSSIQVGQMQDIYYMNSGFVVRAGHIQNQAELDPELRPALGILRAVLR